MVRFGCGTVSFILFAGSDADVLEVRTGQAHRTLHGHTGPITCLQFDEIHIASGSLDKTLRVSCLIGQPGVRLIFSFRYGTSEQAEHLRLSNTIMQLLPCNLTRGKLLLLQARTA
jgi:hypothetical protein